MEFRLTSLIYLQIFSYLPLQEVFSSVAMSCKSFRSICSYNILWEGKFFEIKLPQQTLPKEIFCSTMITNVIENEDKKYLELNVFGGNIINKAGLIDLVSGSLSTLDLSSHLWRFQDLDLNRTEHSAVVYKGDIYVFGGVQRLAFSFKNDLFCFRSIDKTMKIIKIDPFGEIPEPRSAHTAIVYKDFMYVFGGWNGRDTLKDLWCFSFENCTWRYIPAIGEYENKINVPSYLRRHNAICYNNSMFIFGGFSSEKNPTEFNEVFEFNFETEKWRCVPCKGPKPLGRSRASTVQFGKYMYLLGGFDRQVSYGDFWRLNLETFQWEEIPTNLKELGIVGIQQHAFSIVGDWLAIFGGQINDKIESNKLLFCRLGVSSAINC